jgi:hypothetical protein
MDQKEYGMKQGSFRAFCLILWVCLAVFPAFSDENTVNFESVILESFDGESVHELQVEGKTYRYDIVWKTDASKFATKTDDQSYPQLTYVAAWPQALFGLNREGRALKSLGLHGRFDRRGYNWIDLYPVPSDGGDDAEPYEIPIPGRVNYLDMWVWGSNLNYYIEAFIRDHNGIVHGIPFGSIGYTGWKNLRTRVPSHIRQSKRVLPRHAELTFVKFRIWTTPGEKVDDFYIYFDQFKVLTDTFESLFDGDELSDPDRVQELWAEANQ